MHCFSCRVEFRSPRMFMLVASAAAAHALDPGLPSITVLATILGACMTALATALCARLDCCQSAV